MTPPRPGAPEFGLNVIGHITGNLGLAVAARNTLRMLVERGENVSAIDVDPGGGRGGRDSEFASLLAEKPAAPWGVNLFHLNPPEALRVAQDAPRWLDLTGRMNACVPFWELPRLPVTGKWIELLEAVDVVLAPSLFVAEAVRVSAPRAEVVHYPQAVHLPDGVAADRTAFGLPSETVLFFVSLDATSDLERKNPAGALEAFSRAFSDAGEPPVHLVVKLNNSQALQSSAAPAVERIRTLLAETPNVTVLDETMRYDRVLALCASCDVYVSLHRSEGLGLNVLEAMSLAMPCVVTGWSGTMDFTTPENSCIVGYELVSVVATHPSYQPESIGPDQVWADPNIDEAAGWMRKLAADADLRRSIGERAARDMDVARERFSRGEIVDELQARFAGAMSAAAVSARQAGWPEIARMTLAQRLRRTAGNAARAAGLRD